jgi:UDP-glucuronate 4-epimerase
VQINDECITMTTPRPQHVLLTGAAGFVGFHVANNLLDKGIHVTGIDNLNSYYPVQLKQDRLALLSKREGFAFHQVDIADHDALKAVPGVNDADAVIHLAAQAGVRYSIENPFAYGQSNLIGHLSILELVRHAPKKPRLVYASSSSVYGANAKAPFSEDDRVDNPVSLYAATKRSNELMSESYTKLYGMEQVGLRFFTVYGPWGRPDMAYWTFTRDIIEGRAIRVFNNGQLNRDFTWIDDIVAGVVSTALDQPAPPIRRCTASTTSATTAPLSWAASSRSSKMRSASAPRKSWSRCSPATSAPPTPTLMRSPAITASRRRQRWKRAYPASSNGIATTPRPDAYASAKPGDQKPKLAFSAVGWRVGSIRTPSTSTCVPPTSDTPCASSL